jgi:hypothetical protein
MLGISIKMVEGEKMEKVLRFKRFLVIFCFLIYLFLFPSIAISTPDIPDNNLAYPVLIVGNSTTGSGFLYNKADCTYLITARHVLFSETSITVPLQYSIPTSLKHRAYLQKEKDKDPVLIFYGVMSASERDELIKAAPSDSYFKFNDAFEELYKKSQKLELRNNKISLLSYATKDSGGPGRNLLVIDVPKLFKNGMIKYHPTQDVAFIKIATPFQKDGKDMLAPNEGVADKGVKALLGLSSDNFKLFKDVIVGNEVFVFGYPVSITQIDPWTDIKIPLLRKGIIAGKNDELKAIILDCPVFFGNSGGLVIEKEQVGFQIFLKAIGIISQYVPFQGDWFQNSNYSIVVPMDFIEDLITESK